MLILQLCEGLLSKVVKYIHNFYLFESQTDGQTDKLRDDITSAVAEEIIISCKWDTVVGFFVCAVKI